LDTDEMLSKFKAQKPSDPIIKSKDNRLLFSNDEN